MSSAGSQIDTKNPSWDPFWQYLSASVVAAHPTAGNVRDFLHRTSKIAKEIAYQQRRFLDFAKALLDSAPWVTYLTCVKHPYVAKQYNVSAASFPEINDKAYWDDLAIDVETTQAKARTRLDEQKINEVEQLCCYQVVADKVAALPATLLSLRSLRSKLTHAPSSKPWVIAWVSLVLVEFFLAAAFGAAESHSEQRFYRILLIIVGIAAGISLIMGWITGFKSETQRQLRKSYASQFENIIAPCMRLADVDPALGFENLDYVAEIAQYLQKNYEHLKAKLLTI